MSSRPMVLRSVHLPPDMDERLRMLAFGLRMSKADLIRGFVSRGLRFIDEHYGGEIDEHDRERLLQDLGADAELTPAERERSDEALRRMERAAADASSGG